MKYLRWLIVVVALTLPSALVPVSAAQTETRPHPGGLVQADWLIGRPVVNDKSTEIDVRIEWHEQKPIVRLSDAQLRAAERYQAPAASPRTDPKR